MIYSEYFSLKYLNTDIGSKFALISLVCYLTQEVRLKKPKATCLQVIRKITDGQTFRYNEDFLIGLSVVCEDFMLHTTEFLTFDIKTKKEMVLKIKEILDTYLPF